MRIVFCVMAVVLAQQIAAPPETLMAGQPAGAASATLDYEYFKTKVQPLFLEKRAGYTRCVVCHVSGQVGFLVPLAAGSTSWTEEQSRQNFERVSRLVVPGQPMKSRLLTHPLEPSAGGDEFHNGGRQYRSQDDPHFKTLAAWVTGSKGSGTAQR
jgi:hypothetical protein